MTGVIYARYSSDNQREESIEGQLRENRAFAEKNGIDIIETYIDRAYSAKTDNRPEFQRMIRESAKKKYDVVIVWKLDRFSRNRYDSAKYKAILKKNNIRVVSATEAISQGAEGIILESVLEGMAEYYSADLAEKVLRGMTENALKCKYNGSTVPLGYRIDADGHYQLDPVTAPIAREIFTRYAQGETSTEIVEDMNARGLRTGRGVLFNKNTLRNMLNNSNYIGVYHYKDVVIPGGVPAIISEDIFERCKGKLVSNKRTAARNKARERYILTTKLFCGECKSMMVGECGVKKERTYRYYKCASAKRHECDLKPVRKDLIEDFVIGKAISSISDKETVDALITHIMAAVNEENVMIPVLEKQLADVQKSIENIVRAMEEGVYSRSTKAKLEELERQEDELKEKIQYEQHSGPGLTEDKIRFILDKYVHMDLKVQKNRERIVDGLVGSVLLFDDGKVIVTLNFRDEPIVSTLDEIIAVSNIRSDIQGVGSPQRKRRCNAPAFSL